MAHHYVPAACRVLAIEDDEGIRRLYRRALDSLFDVRTADSLTNARQQLSDPASFDVIILDLMMAGESTLDFWAWLTAHAPHLCASTLVVSGYPNDPVFAEIVADRSDWVIAKPVSPWELRDRLRWLMEERPAAQTKQEVRPW